MHFTFRYRIGVLRKKYGQYIYLVLVGVVECYLLKIICVPTLLDPYLYNNGPISIYSVGQERFTSMTRVYYKDTNACIIMFDLTQRSSFENTCKWKKDLDAKCTLPDGRPVPCVLLANKVDIDIRELFYQPSVWCKYKDAKLLTIISSRCYVI